MQKKSKFTNSEKDQMKEPTVVEKSKAEHWKKGVNIILD